MGNYDNYNKIIDQYIKQNEVKSALLLTAPWGSGKSYYIDNVLKKHLNDQHIDIINISLYGISSLQDITDILLKRSIIYCEAIKKLKNNKNINCICNKISKNSKKLGFLKNNTPYIKIIGTKASLLVDGLAKNLNISVTNEDIINLFEKINSNKLLIVFEDVERSDIKILDFLGYVNNFVDCANMKILLVANENIFLKRKDRLDGKDILIKSSKDGEEKDIEVEKYKEYKEKTISDTIKFQSSRGETIKEILCQFDKTYNLNKNKFINLFEMIDNTMDNLDCYNYRVLKFALQKVVDYFDDTINKRDSRFFHVVVYSILRFSIQIRENREPDAFEDNSILGIASMKQYVEGDVSVITRIDYFEESYIEYINKRERDDYANKLIKRLELWFELTQVKLEKLILGVINDIKTNKISCEYYKDLMFFILPLKEMLNIKDEINACKLLCLNNLKDENTDISSINIDEINNFGYDLFIKKGDNRYNEYKLFVDDFISVLKNRKNQNLEVVMTYDNLDAFCSNVMNKEKDFHSMHQFMSDIDVFRLSDLIINSEPQYINRLSVALKSIYDVINIKEIYPNDYNNLELLYNNINSKMNNVKDNVAKYVLNILNNELLNYLTLLK